MFVGHFCPPGSGYGSRDPLGSGSTGLAFDVLPGSVHLVLLLLVEGAIKTACLIPQFDSLCFPCPTWLRPPGAAAAGGRSDIWRRIPRRIPPGPASRGQWSTPLFDPPPGHVMESVGSQICDYLDYVLREETLLSFRNESKLTNIHRNI